MATDRSVDGAGRWLTVFWPLAILFHLAGNGQHLLALQRGVNAVGSVQLAIVVVAGVMLIRPGARAAALLGGLFVLVLWLKMPVVGNHEIILGLFSLAVIPAVVAGGAGWPQTVAPVGRSILLVAYGFVAFSKLNSGFLDAVQSCAVLFADEFGEVAGLRPSDSSWMPTAVIAATVVIEAAIPILLLISRYRRFGVGLALVFHFVLALEPNSHIWDFSATLLPLFLLFAPASALELIDRRLLAIDRRPVSERALGLGLLFAIQGVVMSGGLLGAPTWSLAFPMWLAVSGTITAGYLWFLRTPAAAHRQPQSEPPTRPQRYLQSQPHSQAQPRSARHSTIPSTFLPAGPRWMTVSMLAIVGVAVLNGVSPYLELRTAAAFNMYSNLRVVDGESNHLIVAGIRSADEPSYVALVRVDEGSVLDFYIERSLSVPVESLDRFLSDHPAEDPSIFVDGGAVPARSLGYGELETTGPGWLDELHSAFSRKLGARRAVHTYGAGDAAESSAGGANGVVEPRCLRAWGPIG